MTYQIYEKKHLIQVHEIDFQGRLSICGLFNLLMEIAWENAEQLAFGFQHLRQKELFWVLSKIQLKIYQYPRRLSTITLKTWPKGKIGGLYACRDFQVFNENNQLCAEATSAWLVLDTANRKILKLDTDEFFKQFPEVEDKEYANGLKIKEKTDCQQTDYFPVNPSDIDINEHMNAGKYIERAYNTYDINFLKTHQLTEIIINFNKEGMIGDNIGVIKTRLATNTDVCSIIKETDNAELCRMKIQWRNSTLW